MSTRKRRLSNSDSDSSFKNANTARRKKKLCYASDQDTKVETSNSKSAMISVVPAGFLTLQCVNYKQACLLLQALEFNRREPLSPRCVAHMANYVVQTWETHPEKSKEQQIIGLMNSLLRTTAIGLNLPFQDALRQFCNNTVSTRTPCPSVTLLMTMYYIHRLNERHIGIKGSSGCGSRLILAAYITASKFLHNNLRLLVHNKSTTLPSSPPPSPLTSPPSSQPACSERNARILRMTVELLQFLNYDLSITNPFRLVEWSRFFLEDHTDNYTSGDEGGDEISDDDNDNESNTVNSDSDSDSDSENNKNQCT